MWIHVLPGKIPRFQRCVYKLLLITRCFRAFNMYKNGQRGKPNLARQSPSRPNLSLKETTATSPQEHNTLACL